MGFLFPGIVVGTPFVAYSPSLLGLQALNLHLYEVPFLVRFSHKSCIASFMEYVEEKKGDLTPAHTSMKPASIFICI